MNPDYFLFGLGITWVLFASIQDLKTREVANWLTFSLIFFGLVYKLTYSIVVNEPDYFQAGAVSFLFFTALAYALYYSRAFAGGDAKLLMGIGTIIPGTSAYTVLINGTSFFLTLLFLGALWSIIALFTPLVPITRERFVKALQGKHFKAYIIYALVSVALGAAIWMLSGEQIFFYFFIIVAIITAGYPLLKAADECMIISIRPGSLMEGDWICSDIKIGNKTIRKTVHGLSHEDIRILKKSNKIVTIKTGIPFIPSFFFALLFMVYAWGVGYSLISVLEQLA